jgi:hypothetical protein
VTFQSPLRAFLEDLRNVDLLDPLAIGRVAEAARGTDVPTDIPAALFPGERVAVCCDSLKGEDLVAVLEGARAGGPVPERLQQPLLAPFPVLTVASLIGSTGPS